MIRTDSGYMKNINTIFVAIFTILLLIAFWQIRGILMLVFAGVTLSVLFTMPIRFFMRWGISRNVSIVLSLLSGVLVIVVLLLLVFPTLFSQFGVLFTETIPTGTRQLIEEWNNGKIYERLPFLENIVKNLDLSSFRIDADFLNQLFTQATQAINQVGGSVLPLVGGVASALVSIMIIFFLCIYLIAEPDKYMHGIIHLTPLWYRDRVRTIIMRLDNTIRGWLRVTGVSMLLIGGGTAIGLAVVGIEQWLALGVLAGILSFVPNFGMIATLIPAIAVTIIQVPNAVWIVILIIAVISLIQAQIVGPILTADTMNLPPVLILIGQIVFGVFFGFMGLMLAVPLTAITVVLVEEIYIKDVLGDDSIDEEPKVKMSEEDSEEDDGLIFAEAD